MLSPPAAALSRQGLILLREAGVCPLSEAPPPRHARIAPPVAFRVQGSGSGFQGSGSRVQSLHL